MKECEQVEKARQRFAAERARIISARFGPAGVTPQMSLPGVASPTVNNNIGNNRQQVMSASPSQPSISGYASNQPVHPHMPFMPRQPMFPMGPRLPLTAMQASTSAPPNVMFNSPGNTQPTLNHPLMRSVSGTSSGLGWNGWGQCKFGFYGWIPLASLLSFCTLKKTGSLDKLWKHLAASMYRSYLKQFLGLVTSYN